MSAKYKLHNIVLIQHASCSEHPEDYQVIRKSLVNNRPHNVTVEGTFTSKAAAETFAAALKESTWEFEDK